MKTIALVAAAGFVLGGAPQEGFTPLFNGKDLTGWINVNGAPSTWSVRDGMIVTTGIPNGVLRTEKQYENYILELEWRHVKEGGNAGLFIHSDALTHVGSPFTRSIEVQIMLADNPTGDWTRHGDVFAIQGADMVPDRAHPKGWKRCLPSENRVKGAGEWNHYRVECRDGKIDLAVNGKVVSGGSKCNPRKGYICLESEGSECHFRNIRIRELPSSNPPAAEVAEADQGFRSIFTGVDLSGWKPDSAGDGHFTVKNGVLEFGDGKKGKVPTERSFRNFVVIFDWKSPGEGGRPICVRGDHQVTVKPAEKPNTWVRTIVRVEGEKVKILRGDKVEQELSVPKTPAQGPFCILSNGPAQFRNIYVKELDR